MIKTVGRHPVIPEVLGKALAGYIGLVKRTTTWRNEPHDLHEAVAGDLPISAAMWHGQHFFIPILRPDWMRSSALASRHFDGEINAIALQHLGIEVIRGSGGRGSGRKVRKRGSVAAMRELMRALGGGSSVVVTADVPKVSRVAGPGLPLLAKLSGRPIYPVAVATRRRVTLNSWDRATISLPFGQGGLVLGQRITVARDAGEAELEAARLEVQNGLDDAHRRAYALAGGASWKALDG
jgi:lysophospholipid acyltransferase (LPLAT)-like uncharacterized protein